MKNTTVFVSCLKEKFESYLNLRENQGHKVSNERHIFITLDTYLQDNRYCGQNLPPYIIDGWISALPDKLNVNTVNIYISQYIQFAKYMQSFGITAFIPEKSIGNKSYIPYIFCGDQLAALIKATDTMMVCSAEKYHHNVACFTVMIRMFIGCGFRLNEIRLLKTEDVDINQGIIHIKNAKGNKDRLVPMHESLTKILRIYIQSSLPQKDGWFFPSVTGNPISPSWIRDTFTKCIDKIGVERPSLEKHARNICLHCLRHSYAVSALRQLDHKGIDLYSEIPILSTYMGHENLYGTEHYLHLTVENSHDILSKMEEFNKGLFPEVAE